MRRSHRCQRAGTVTSLLALLLACPLATRAEAPFRTFTLENGLTLLRCHVPGRPLLQAQLIVRGDAGGGGTSEDPAQAGATVLAARAMSEGTAQRDAIEFVEATDLGEWGNGFHGHPPRWVNGVG